MLVNVKGKVLEKFSRESKTPEGAKTENLYIRIYQPGQRVNLDIKVKADTFTLVDVGEDVELEDIIVSTFKDNLYARQ